MKHGSLFSGIGGFDLAAEWMGWKNVFHCEIDPFCQKILKRHFPKSISYGDIKQTDFTIHRGGIDILTGGFPCQPFSLAGEGKGSDDNRYLWPEMFRVIREIQPAWVVGENVPGIFRKKFKLAFEDICTSLESEGYSLQIFNIPSASIGSWDKRNRVWFIAYNYRFGCNYEQEESEQSLQNKNRDNTIKEQGGDNQQCGVGESDTITSNFTQHGERELSIQQRGQDKTRNIDIDGKIKEHSDLKSTVGKCTRKTRPWRNGRPNKISDTYQSSLQGYSWNELTKGQKETIRRGGEANWKRNWIEVASELCGSNARIPNRVDRIKSLGNSVNPHAAFQIFKAIEIVNKYF
jgi:DNA (cytosine-5)-methyltransferase 1